MSLYLLALGTQATLHVTLYLPWALKQPFMSLYLLALGTQATLHVTVSTCPTIRQPFMSLYSLALGNQATFHVTVSTGSGQSGNPSCHCIYWLWALRQPFMSLYLLALGIQATLHVNFAFYLVLKLACPHCSVRDRRVCEVVHVCIYSPLLA